MPNQLRAETTLDVNLHFQSAVNDLEKKKEESVYFRRLMLLHVYSNRYLRNHTGKVVLRVFPSCWKLLAFDQIQLDAYCAAVRRWFEAIFKLRPVIWKLPQIHADTFQFNLQIWGSLNKFPYFFHMGTFIDRTHMKL